MDLANHYGTPKLWARAHENGPKMPKRQVFGHASENVLSVMGLVNHPGIPKLWAIAHKNVPKMEKR
jgi:hypothetical protein